MNTVPLILYRNGSGAQNKAKMDWPGQKGQEPLVSNVNLASAVTALLGVPAPAHSTGTGRLMPIVSQFLPGLDDDTSNSAAHLGNLLSRDLYTQQAMFGRAIGQEVGQQFPLHGDDLKQFPLHQQFPIHEDDALKQCLDEMSSHASCATLTAKAYICDQPGALPGCAGGVIEANDAFLALRAADMRHIMFRNLGTAFVLVVLLLWSVVDILELKTPCDPRLLLPKSCCSMGGEHWTKYRTFDETDHKMKEERRKMKVEERWIKNSNDRWIISDSGIKWNPDHTDRNGKPFEDGWRERAKRRWKIVKRDMRIGPPEGPLGLKYVKCVEMNRNAAAMSFLCVLAFYAINVAIFCISSWLRGFGGLPDSSMIHNIGGPVYIYAVMAFVPAAVTQFLIGELVTHHTRTGSWIIRKIEAKTVEKHACVIKAHGHVKKLENSGLDAVKCTAKFTASLAQHLMGHESTESWHDKDGIVLLLLCKYYLCMWTAISIAILWMCQAPNSVLLPFIMGQRWVNPTLWVLRFRVVTLQFMTLPLILGGWRGIHAFPKQKYYEPASRTLDGLYELAAHKQSRWRERVLGTPQLGESIFDAAEHDDAMVSSDDCFTNFIRTFVIGGTVGPTGEVLLTLSREGNELKVTVLETRKLRRMDMRGNNDVYVSVQVDHGDVQRTKTIDEGGVECKWNGKEGELLTFKHEGQIRNIVVKVFDEDLGHGQVGDDMIGACTLKVHSMGVHSLEQHEPASRFWKWPRDNGRGISLIRWTALVTEEQHDMPDKIQNPLEASPALAPPSQGGFWTGKVHSSHMVTLSSVLESGAEAIDAIHVAKDNTLSGSLHDIFLGQSFSTPQGNELNAQQKRTALHLAMRRPMHRPASAGHAAFRKREQMQAFTAFAFGAADPDFSDVESTRLLEQYQNPSHEVEFGIEGDGEAAARRRFQAKKEIHDAGVRLGGSAGLGSAGRSQDGESPRE